MNDSLRVEIERYLAGGMTEAEASAFLDALRKDRDAMSYLARVLEDEAHLFDAAREAAPQEATPRRLRIRRPRFWPRADSSAGLFWAAGLAAAALIAVLVLSRPSVRPPPAPPPRDVVVEPKVPPPEVPPPPPRREPERPSLPPRPPLAPPPREEAPPRREEPAPRAPEPSPPREPAGKTFVAIATLERVQGECFTMEGAERISVKAGTSLLSGRGLQSSGRAVVLFPDGTRLELGEGAIRELALDSGGKRVSLESGTLAADVTRQPAGSPLRVVTPQAEIAVLGTRFTILCGADSTRVEVREGRVKVTRRSDSASAEVPAGQFALVAAGSPVVSKPFPIDDILLLPAQGKIVGADWRSVRDPDSGSGAALEAPRSRSGPLQDAPCVSFVFNADADRTYFAWVRGKCLAATNRIEHDAVVLEFSGAEVTEPSGPNKGLAGSLERALFNGFMHWSGYGWVGGDADEKRDATPVTVRFTRAGRQSLKLYVTEGPVRIDAIWLSSTQKTRPDEAQTGPPPEKK